MVIPPRLDAQRLSGNAMQVCACHAKVMLAYNKKGLLRYLYVARDADGQLPYRRHQCDSAYVNDKGKRAYVPKTVQHCTQVRVTFTPRSTTRYVSGNATLVHNSLTSVPFWKRRCGEKLQSGSQESVRYFTD